MSRESIRSTIKEIIANVANIDPAEITDDARFVEDLALDSLSLLEIGVDVDYAFKLGVPEDELQKLRSVADTVRLVEKHRVDEQPADEPQAEREDAVTAQVA